MVNNHSFCCCTLMKILLQLSVTLIEKSAFTRRLLQSCSKFYKGSFSRFKKNLTNHWTIDEYTHGKDSIFWHSNTLWAFCDESYKYMGWKVKTKILAVMWTWQWREKLALKVLQLNTDRYWVPPKQPRWALSMSRSPRQCTI